MRKRDWFLGGFALAVALPWVLAVAGFALALGAWVGSEERVDGALGVAAEESPELRTVRLALATSQKENESLRQELDRLLDLVSSLGADPGAKGAHPPAVEGAASDAVDAETTARAKDLAANARAALARGAGEEAAQAIVELTKFGPAAYASLEELYHEAEDPAARRLLFPTLLAVGGRQKGMDFLAAELGRATDPEERARLLFNAATFAKKQEAPVLQDAFLDSLADPALPPKLRAYTLRGLAHAKGPGVDEALWAAASDSAEPVRIAAIRALASRGRAGRERLEALLAREPSPLVRQLGECQLLLREQGG